MKRTSPSLWVKLPTQLDHLPVQDIEPLDDPATFGFWVRCWFYASDHMTDGVIPRSWRRASPEVVDSLVDAGLLAMSPDGELIIPQFLELNQSREVREHYLERKRRNTARWREKLQAESGVTGHESGNVPGACPQGMGYGVRETGDGAEPPAPDGAAGKSTPPRRVSKSDHTQVIDTFHRAYEIATGGHKPTWNGKTGALVRKLLQAHGRDEVLERMGRFFENQVPEFIWRDSVPDFPSFVQHFDKIPKATTRARGRGRNGRLTGDDIRELSDRLEKEGL